MRGLPPEHWLALFCFSVLGEIALGAALLLDWLPFKALDGAVLCFALAFVLAPIVVLLLADKRALPAVITVFLPLVVCAFLVSRSLDASFINIATTSSLIASGIWGRLFLVKARQFLDGSRCENCLYDLRADTEGRCPECGTEKQVTGFRASDFPGIRNSLTKPKLALVTIMIVPLILLTASLRLAKPYQWQIEEMIANNDFVGMGYKEVNRVFGISRSWSMPSGWVMFQISHLSNDVEIHFIIKNDIIVNAYLTYNDSLP